MTVVFAWVAAVLVLSAPLGLSAFAAAVFLVVSGAADDTGGIKGMPWSAILMVCGVAMLVTTAERAGGLNLFTALLARLATPDVRAGSRDCKKGDSHLFRHWRAVKKGGCPLLSAP